MLQLMTMETVARTRELSQSLPSVSRIRVRAVVKGTGQVRLAGDAGLLFGAMMLEEPTFSAGLIAANMRLKNDLPTGTAMVLAWKKSGDFWIGADLGFVIENPGEGTAVFSLTFEGSTLRTTQPIGATL